MPNMMINKIFHKADPDQDLSVFVRKEKGEQKRVNMKAAKARGAKRRKGHGKHGGVPGQAYIGRPLGEKAATELCDKRWIEEEDFGYYGARIASRKEFDHPSNRKARVFAISEWRVHGVFGCPCCVEGTVDNRFLNRAKVERRRKQLKMITKDMLEDY
jgi:hypothetical protein